MSEGVLDFYETGLQARLQPGQKALQLKSYECYACKLAVRLKVSFECLLSIFGTTTANSNKI